MALQHRKEFFAATQRARCGATARAARVTQFAIGIDLATMTEAGGTNNGTRYDSSVGSDDLGDGGVDGGGERFVTGGTRVAARVRKEMPMFSIPIINALTLPSLFGGTIVVPAGGALFAAILIAALVGSALGVLREATSPHPRGDVRHLDAVPPAAVDHHDHHEHRQAA